MSEIKFVEACKKNDFSLPNSYVRDIMRLMYKLPYICLFFILANASLFAKDAFAEKETQEPSASQVKSEEVSYNCNGCSTCPSNQCGPAQGFPPQYMGPPAPPPNRGMPQNGMPPPNGRPPQPPAGTVSGALFQPPSPPGTLTGTLPRANCPQFPDGYTVNFQDISIIELIQFISQISHTNYIFDHRDLLYPSGDVIKVTIVSQEATSVEDLSSALLQILKMHNLFVTEQGNNVLIYRNQNLSKVSTIITDSNVSQSSCSAVITRVFNLYNVDPENIRPMIQQLVSQDAIVEVSTKTRHLIVSDITANVDKIAELLAALENPNAAFEFRAYNTQTSDPRLLVAFAKDILSPLVFDNPMQIVAQPSARKIFILSTPYLVQKAIEVLTALDHADITEAVDLPSIAGMIPNSSFFMYKLKYQNGAEIADALRNIGVNLEFAGIVNPDFLSAVYSTQWVPVNNSIIVTGTPDSVQKVVELINELDMQPKQVYVEVLIIDTTLENSLDFGVQWIALGDEQNKLAFASGLLSPGSPNLQGGTLLNGQPTPGGARFVASNPAETPPAIPNPGRDVPLPNAIANTVAGPLLGPVADQLSAFGLGFVGNIIRHNGQSFLTLGALVSALDAEGQVVVVTNPKIMVEDNQPADFFVGQNIPYQTTSTVIQQTGSVTQNIQYEDIGVQLRVVPTISPDNIVTLQIDQSIVDLVTLTTNGLIAPVTNKTLASTRVHVPDGTFLVMSGQIRDVASCTHSGIPCLGSLPLIGPAFSRSVDIRSKRNLIFFIRPKVVGDIEKGLEVTNQEGYDYNWESHPCSITNCTTERAPECETYPPARCPDH